MTMLSTENKRRLHTIGKVIEALAIIGIDNEDFADLVAIRNKLKEVYRKEAAEDELKT